MLKVSKNRVHSLVLTKLHHYYNLRLHSRRIGSAGSCIGVHWGVQGLHWACSLGAFTYIFSVIFFSAFLSPRPGECNGPTVAACASAGAPTGGPLQRCTRLVRAPRLRRPFFRPCAQGFDDFFYSVAPDPHGRSAPPCPRRRS